MNVRLTEEHKKTRIMGGKDVFKIIREVLLRESKYRQEQEHFWILSLAEDNLILNLELVSLGSNKRALLEPMQVFRLALIKNAAKIVMIHNHVHENNELMPGPADTDVTDRMIKVGEIIDVEVVEHLIVTTGAFFSFRESGLLGRLRSSEKYALKEHEIIKIRKEAERIGEERGLKRGRKEGEKKGLEKKAIEMAKGLKKKGVDIDLISETSGLSREEIERL